MGVKRVANKATQAAKKVKLDPVSAKVKEVLDALRREDCTVGGPPEYLEGLVAAFPLAFGLEAAKDERHAYQERVGNIVLELLQTNEAKFKESHKAAKDEQAAGEVVKSSKAEAVTQAETALSDQQKAETEARDRHSGSTDATLLAQDKLGETTTEVDNFDAVQLEKAKDHAEYGSAMETEFASLKAGTVEDAKEKKSLFATVKTVLTKIHVDKAMIMSAEPALVKAAATRGSFDNTVVEEVENALRARMTSLQEDLNNGETVKASKVAEKDAAQVALNEAEATEAENKRLVTEADAKTKELKAALKDAKANLKEQEKIVSDLDIKALYQESHADNFSAAIVACEFLRDRVSVVPEAVEAKVTAMETDAVNTIVA